MRKMLSSIVLLSVVLFTGCVNNTSISTHNSTTKHGDLKVISFKKAKGMQMAGSALFLDARGAKLYKKGTITGAMHMPAKKFKKYSKFLPAKKNAKVVTFCNGPKCHLAPKLAKLLKSKGYTKVYVYSGGYPEWKEKKQEAMAIAKKCK